MGGGEGGGGRDRQAEGHGAGGPRVGRFGRTYPIGAAGGRDETKGGPMERGGGEQSDL